MKAIRWYHLALAIVVLVIGPVLLRQIMPPDHRQFSWVSLDETQHVEISFSNTAQNLQLGGLLFIPGGSGPFPAVAIIHGSGTSQRDNGWYLTLTQYLQNNGIAVLLPDKRGSEKSEGDWRTANMQDLATDTLAAVEFLRSQDIVAVSSIGVVGMSQGGSITPIVATETDDVEFIVSVVGSAVRPNEQLLYEENYNLQQMGFLPGISYVISLMSTAHIRHIRQPEFWDGMRDFNVLDYWQDVSVDALVLLGRDDTNVPSEESAKRLRSLGKPNIEVVIYDSSGHALEDPPGQGDSIFREDALEAIRSFVHRSK